MDITETEKKTANLDIEMSNEEYDNLFYYGFKNISDENLKELIVEWAINDILEKNVKKL